ncbi:MAG: alpha/beta fold hydrolase [Pseudonocardiales bacterium]|nr:alpha/beta fold hydrolase [Pseudonocardiales bacterium]
MHEESSHKYQSLDGFELGATLLEPASNSHPEAVVVLVHGITANRDEGGFYKNIAEALADQGFRSFRFDLRGHGESEGSMEDLTLYGGVSDIAATCQWLTHRLDDLKCIALVAASFGGGLAALYASCNPVWRLVLLNPNLDYAENWLQGTPNWTGNSLTSQASQQLRNQGWIYRGDFHLSRPMVNEAMHVRPADLMAKISAPTLTIHGTDDSMVSFNTARDNYQTSGNSKFIAIAGADHGFVVPGDEDLENPRTINYRKDVIEKTIDWIVKENDNSSR